jgi:serine phosphatase RsbU (regulator of sigma subunit)
VVSGDFYWLENVNNTSLYAAAYCTGHGVPGAMVSVVCINALNRSVREFGLVEPSKILDKTRELVIDTFERSDHEVKDGMDISLCALNLATNELTWSGANNPLWVLRKGAKKLEETKADKQPIGNSDNVKSYTLHTIKLNEGDMVYTFTDGYQDQFWGPRGRSLNQNN